MVLVATVEKARVVYAQPGLWNIAMRMELRDGANVAIDADYFARFRTGDTIESKAPVLIDAMQADIDQYKSEQLIFNNAELATLATTVKAALEL